MIYLPKWQDREICLKNLPLFFLALNVLTGGRFVTSDYVADETLNRLIAMPIMVNLERARAQRKMRLNDLADGVGISPQNLSLLKIGKAKASRFFEIAGPAPGGGFSINPDGYRSQGARRCSTPGQVAGPVGLGIDQRWGRLDPAPSAGTASGAL